MKKYRWILVILFLVIIGLVIMNIKKGDNETLEKKSVICKEAVQEYLDGVNKNIQDIQTKKGDTIGVKYIGRFESGEVFDTNLEEVAKKCGIYQTGRNYNETLDFQIGAGLVVPGFDAAVDGMKVGSTTTVTLLPEDAYGEKDKNLIKTIKKDDIQNADQYKEGQVLQDPYGRRLEVIKVTSDTITLDANSPMAGKTLIFDITLVEIK